MAAKKILFVNQEINPYLPANEISSLGKSLPQSLHGKGYVVRTFMPKFGAVNERRNQLHEVIRLSGLNIEINDNDHPLILKVASMQPARIQVYFIDNDDYFTKEDSDIDVFGSDREDNDERAIYFARGTMETVKKLRWEPEIVQVSGWISALTPIYLRQMTANEGLFKDSKIIYCVEPHNPQMALIDTELVRKLKEDGIPAEFADKFIPDFEAKLPPIPESVESDKESVSDDSSESVPEADSVALADEASVVVSEGEESAESPAPKPVNVNVLHKMAIDCAQGVVFLTDQPDPELLAFVEEKGLPYITKDKAQKGKPEFVEFYNKILEA